MAFWGPALLSPRTSSSDCSTQLLPLLITALDLPDPSLRANVIDTLSILAKEVPGDMENSISGIALKVLRDVVDSTNVKGAVVRPLLSSFTMPDFLLMSGEAETSTGRIGVLGPPAGAHPVRDAAPAEGDDPAPAREGDR